MLVAVLIFTITGILLAVVFQPRLIYVLVWPVLFLYPHQYWATVSPLPINIGFDDLFLVFCGAVAFFRLGGQPGGLQSWPMKVALSWLLIVFVCGTVGLMKMPRGDILLMHVQDVLKVVGFCLLTYALIKTVQSKADLYRCIGSLSVSIILAAVILILAGRSPVVARIFLIGRMAEDVASAVASGQVVRVGGTFGASSGAAEIMALCMCFVLLMIGQCRSVVGKITFIAGALLMVIALMVSQGRSGALGLATIVIMLPFLRGMRKWGIMAAVVIILVGSTMPATYMPMVARIYESFAQPFQEVPYGVTVRFDVWKTYLKSLDPLVLLLGQGESVAWAKAQRLWFAVGLPHSGYIDLVAFFGIWGVIWIGVVIRGLLKRLAILRRSLDPDLQRLATAVILYLVVLAVCAITNDPFRARVWELLLLLAISVFIDRAVLLAQEQAEMAYAPPEEASWPAYPDRPWIPGVARARG